MANISFFAALIVTHIIADWIFQTNWESKNKDKKILPLLVHGFVYSVSFIPALYFYKASFLWLFFLFITHIFLDQRKFEFWLLKLKGYKKEELSEAKLILLLIGIDQAFHVVVLTIIAIFA